MKFVVEYPLGIDDEAKPWAAPSSMAAFATALEAAGVDAIAFTDHPAPSKKWLGGAVTAPSTHSSGLASAQA